MPHPFTENASLNPKKGEIDMDDSNIHIVKRTDQWKERAVQSYIVPRGVLCVELTPDGNTRIKIGEGNKYYSQLPYIGANIDISKYFTKEEVKKLVEDTSEATVVAYMDKQPYVRVLGPILPSASALPKTGNKDGDIRFVKMAKVTPDGKAYIEYVWFNNRWDPLSSAIDIDVSKFATKEELAAVQKTANELAKRVTLLEQAKHIHLNKSIIDSITAPFTTELAAKLAGIEPNANKYVLPIATRHSLGGIIIGEGLLIDSNGRASVDTSGIIVPPYDDTEVKRRITNLENVAHTHDNKSILDATTASYTTTEKSKLAGLENYDDTALSGRVTTLEESSHTHTNKSVLDNTTASYTTEEQTKLAGLENYTLPTASSNTLGGIKVGANLSIDQDGVLSATGGESKEYLAGYGISITERSEEHNTPVDISSEHWVNESPTGGGSRYTISTDRTYLLQRYSLAAGTSFKVKFVPTNPTDIIYYGFDSYPSNSDGSGGIVVIGQTGPVDGFEVDQSRTYTMPADRNSLDVYIRINDTIWSSSDVVSAASFTELKLIITDTVRQGTFIDANVRDGLEIDPDDNTINVTPATTQTIGGIIVGNNLSIDANGVLSATGGACYTAGNGINIRTESIVSEYDTSSEYYSIDETDLGTIGSSFTLTSERAALPKYAFVASHYNNNWNGPVLFSKNPEAVKYDTRGYTSNPVAFTYNNETWYRSDNGYWYQNSSISTNIKVDDLTGVVYDESDLVDYICSLLDTMHTESHAETIIENTGVLDINKNQDGDLVVSSIEGDKVITIPSGESGDYRAGDGIEIVEQTEPSVVEIDISDGWVNKVVTAGGSRSSMDDNKTYMRFRYPCTPGQKFKLRFTPSNATDVVYFNVFGFSSDDAVSGGQKMYPLDGDWSTDQTAEITVLDGYPSVDFTLRLNNPGWGQGSDITAASFSEMVMIVQEDVPVGEKYINVTPATTTDIGGVKVGDGLSITSDGTLSANAGVEYVAGDGISIDQGSTESSDITELQWEQGSINPVNGEPDDFTTTVIRSPMIEVGLTNMLNVSAQDTSDNDMRWEAAFYDSNSEFISMITTWQTLSDEVIRPDNTKYVVILLRKETETEIDENALKACEISWPIEIGKYVVTNTGVTHVGLTDNGSVIYVENGSTNTLLTFGQDLDVTNGVVSIPDYHRLVLNVEE